MNYCGLHWSLKMVTVVTTAVTLSNSACDWPGSDIRTGKTYMSSTLQPHFKDNGGHLSTHKQITLHIKDKEPHVFLSPHHNHLSHHNSKAVVHRVYCHSPVTICHNYSHYHVLSCIAHATCWFAVCLTMWSARGVCTLLGANVCNTRLHLAVVGGGRMLLPS